MDKQPRVLSFVEKTQYDFGEDGSNACTSIALAALNEYATTENVSTVSDIDWECAMEFGAKAWRKWWDKIGHINGKPFQFVKEIYDLPMFKSIRKVLTLCEEYSGPIHEENAAVSASEFYDTLENTIDTLFLFGKDHFAVVTIRFSSFCLICHDINQVWLFDSHGSLLDPDSSTTAVFYNPASLCRYILTKFPKRLKSASLFPKDENSLYDELEKDDNSFFLTLFKKKQQ